MVSIVHVSNALGTVNPVHEIVKAAHAVGAKVLIDGAQSSPHMPVDVQELGCDFFACSGHKMYGPTGIGILYGRSDVLESMPPYHGGGDMIQKVSFEGSTYKAPPGRFEAGTPNICGTVALGAAVDFLERLGRDHIAAHETNVTNYAEQKLAAVDGLNIIGKPKHRAGAVSFILDDVHPHDIGTILDGSGIAIRAGHHCAQPLMRRFGVPATARASFGLYNTREEVDVLVEALGKVRKLFV
jgi:cysteine desulfurase/selenocysteine lyase